LTGRAARSRPDDNIVLVVPVLDSEDEEEDEDENDVHRKSDAASRRTALTLSSGQFYTCALRRRERSQPIAPGFLYLVKAPEEAI